MGRGKGELKIEELKMKNEGMRHEARPAVNFSFLIHPF
jgi:hypothetical protein